MYIVWFNTRYKRQFEAAVSKEGWDEAVRELGVAGAVTDIIANRHRVKNKRRATTKAQRSVRAFVTGALLRPDIYGNAYFKVGRSKKELLNRGRAELSVISTRSGIHVHRKRRSRGAALR